MTAIPRAAVVDASVMIKYLVPEAETPLVQRMMRQWLNTGDILAHAPELLYLECANVLWKKVRRGDVDIARAEASLADLMELELETAPLAQLASPALALAHRYQISAYDASYLALSEQLGLPLITADRRLANILAGTGHHILTVAEFAT